MNIGMLWFDNDPKAELETKIERAATYYRKKYGQDPTLCFVHPSMLAEKGTSPNESAKSKALQSGGVEVRLTRSVLPNHFWIGINGVAS